MNVRNLDVLGVVAVSERPHENEPISGSGSVDGQVEEVANSRRRQHENLKQKNGEFQNRFST